MRSWEAGKMGSRRLNAEANGIEIEKIRRLEGEKVRGQRARRMGHGVDSSWRLGSWEAKG